MHLSVQLRTRTAQGCVWVLANLPNFVSEMVVVADVTFLKNLIFVLDSRVGTPNQVPKIKNNQVREIPASGFGQMTPKAASGMQRLDLQDAWGCTGARVPVPGLLEISHHRNGSKDSLAQWAASVVVGCATQDPSLCWWPVLRGPWTRIPGLGGPEP